MKKIILILFISIIGSIGFLILNKHYNLTDYDITLFSGQKEQVRVDFVNKSDENIQSITIFSSSGKIENIKVGESRSITFKHSGEGTYQFVVNFDSGKQIKEGERYIEAGYFVTEYIYNNDVKTDYNHYK